MVEQVDRTPDQQQVDPRTVADNFARLMNGRLEQSKIDAAVETIKSTATAYSAHGSVASLIFYQKWQVVIDGGKTFDGHAGGLSSPGGGALFGTVYTDDINRLYRDTVSFAFESASAYTSVQFFDGNSNLLGHLQAGGLSTVAGIGGGSGKWS